MLYTALKYLSKTALIIYFKKVQVKGIEHIPKEGPYLIVANHPSSFLDPISIAVLIQQRISFLAKSVLFKNKIVAYILRKLNIVPIYRAQDNPKQTTKNEAVFEACYKELKNKGIILIFPEGTSEHERKLRKIKTGAARIALGTAKEYNYNVNVQILPIGLNYTKSSRFKSELHIEINPPISTDNYFDEYKKDEVKTVQQLTKDIELSINDLIVNIHQQEHDDLVLKIESLFDPQLQSLSNADPTEKLKSIQEIYKATLHFQQTDPGLYKNLKTRIDNYFLNLQELNIQDRSLRSKLSLNNIWKYSFISIIILILGFPFWLFGYINSYIPYKLPRYIALKITDSEAFYGALLLSLGTFSFIIFYCLETLICWKISNSILITICYALALPLCGFFTIYYSRKARKFYYNWQLISKFFKNQEPIAEVIAERKKLILELEKIQRKYLIEKRNSLV